MTHRCPIANNCRLRRCFQCKQCNQWATATTTTIPNIHVFANENTNIYVELQMRNQTELKSIHRPSVRRCTPYAHTVNLITYISCGRGVFAYKRVHHTAYTCLYSRSACCVYFRPPIPLSISSVSLSILLLLLSARLALHCMKVHGMAFIVHALHLLMSLVSRYCNSFLSFVVCTLNIAGYTALPCHAIRSLAHSYVRWVYLLAARTPFIPFSFFFCFPTIPCVSFMVCSFSCMDVCMCVRTTRACVCDWLSFSVCLRHIACVCLCVWFYVLYSCGSLRGRYNRYAMFWLHLMLNEINISHLVWIEPSTKVRLRIFFRLTFRVCRAYFHSYVAEDRRFILPLQSSRKIDWETKSQSNQTKTVRISFSILNLVKSCGRV